MCAPTPHRSARLRPRQPPPAAKATYDKTLVELSKRLEALYAKEAALPGLPHPEVDPGLARELGHDAAEMLEARARAVNLLVSAGVAAGEEAIRQAYRAEIKALGFDPLGFNLPGLHPGDPNALADLPPEARSRIANAGAVAVMAYGGSTVMAREIVRALAGSSAPELGQVRIERRRLGETPQP